MFAGACRIIFTLNEKLTKKINKDMLYKWANHRKSVKLQPKMSEEQMLINKWV